MIKNILLTMIGVVLLLTVRVLISGASSEPNDTFNQDALVKGTSTLSDRFDFHPDGPSEKTFPASPQPIPYPINSKRLSDLFPLDHMVWLRTPRELPLSSLQDAVFLNGFWFVIDVDEQMVLQFDEFGAFVRILGKAGQGPGAYLSASKLKPVFGGHLGILDSQKGVIHVYTTSGGHVLSTPIQGPRTEWLFASGRGFIWDQYERLYRANTATLSEDDPWHAVFTLPERPAEGGVVSHLTISHGFGQRFEFYRQSVGSGILYNSFVRVGDTIWTGSPYDTRIEIFDLDGRSMGQLEHPCPNGMTHAKMEGMAAEELGSSRWMNTYGVNFGIHPTDHLVLVHHGRMGFLVYDTHGNLVTKNHLINDLMNWPVATFHDFWVTEFRSEQDYDHRYFPNESEVLTEMGCTDQDLENHSFLRVGVYGGP